MQKVGGPVLTVYTSHDAFFFAQEVAFLRSRWLYLL